ncbi:MAG: cupin domain-containing protein [Candidatus Omnitrophota bacterium]|nr:cupin domain-containing protein [Candidatus Omnitrophota bacterium]MDZ4243222.1 cupin domain-containing protein [Candidatus Omnitrophota bacterium]
MSKTLFQKMLIVTLFLGMAAAVPASRAMADDPLQVGPDIYKLVLENERVRVLQVTFKPGASIALHSHPDHLIYVTSGGKLLLKYPDGSTKEMEAQAGEMIWVPAEAHAADNMDDHEVVGMVIELKEPAPLPAPAPQEQP